ncbi:hypothetical protein BY996DRAFT_8477525 [Phakopsora pachyrhizi]|nr:hypothetical protein BY996DRAFT_8477525 [Phakopsora pachyrhizi]
MITKVKLILFFVIFLRDCELIEELFPYKAHSLLKNDLLDLSIEGISCIEKNCGEGERGIEASDRTLTRTSKSDLLDGSGWDGRQSSNSIPDSSINFNPANDHSRNTEVAIDSSNQQVTMFSEEDLFDGTGWDWEESFASLLELDDLWNTADNHYDHMLLSDSIKDAFSLENSLEEATCDQPSIRNLSKAVKPNIGEGCQNSKLLVPVEKKSFKKKKPPFNLKILDTSFELMEKNRDTQDNLYNFSGKAIPMQIAANDIFSSSWWHDIFLPDVINSLTEGDATLGFQIFLDKMDAFAGGLKSSYKDEEFWNKLNGSIENSQLENFKSSFGEILYQGDEPYHTLLIESLKKKISMAGSPEKLTQFLPLFDAMELQGKKTGFIYINNAIFNSFFQTENSKNGKTNSFTKLKIPLLDKTFYQVLSSQVDKICLQLFFEDDYGILKYKAFLTYTNHKIMPENLMIYMRILKGKLLIRNLYLVITTLINKLLCEGHDDLKENFFKRQKDTIEFYDLVWKSLKLESRGEFIIDTNVLPKLDNKKDSISTRLLIANIAKPLADIF